MRSNSLLLVVLSFSAISSVACAREPAPTPAPTAAPAPAASAQSTAKPAATPASQPVAAPQRDADPFFSGFEPESTWVVAIDGTESKGGQVWAAKKAGNALVLDLPELSELVLVQPRQQSVEALPRDAWITQLDGTGALAAAVAPRSVGSLVIVEQQVSMKFDGKTLELREAPYQLGFKTMAELLASNAHYRFSSSRYRPSEPIVRNLAAIPQPIEVQVFFGTWCPHCSDVLPKLFAVVQGLEGSKFSFRFYGLPKGEAFASDKEAQKYKIGGVPTAVFLSGGKEVARMDGGSWRIPELGIQNTLLNVGIK